MSHSPRVSVVMTAYNGSRYIRETIESVLDQTYRDFEFIIIEDCSKDDTAAIIASYDDPRIRFYPNPENLGISRSRNRGISLAQGEFVAATDQDDISLAERLERQVAYLDAHPEVVMAATAAKELCNGRMQSYYLPETRPHILRWALFTRSHIVHSSICFRREVQVKQAIEYDPQYSYAEDYLLFHHFAHIGDIVIMDDELMIYRQYPQNNSTVHNAEMTDNGIRFMGHCYREYLGLDLEPATMRLLWQVFNQGTLIKDDEQLLAAGREFHRAMEAYIARCKLSVDQEQELRQWSSRKWWQVVSGQMKQSHRHRLHRHHSLADLYQAIPALAITDPPPMEWLRARAVTSLPVPLVEFLRRYC